MKSIFGRLMGTHPSATATDLSWLKNLDRLEDVAAIEISTEKLKACLDNDNIRAAERLNFVLSVDTENRHRAQKIRRQFVGYENMRPDLEEHTASVMYLYLRQIFIAYRSFIDRFLDTNGDVIFSYNRLPVILGRALESAYTMARWRYYRQQSVPDMTWPEIHDLYRILEQESLLDLTVPLYRDEPEVHLAASFVQACMLDSLGSSGLSKQQVERFAQLLQKLMPWSSINKHYNEHRHLFYIDLAGRLGARRIRMHEPRPDFRYWDTDPLTARIDTLIQTLGQGLPHELENFGSDSDIMEALTQMQSEWSRVGYTRQRRSEERHKVAKHALASHGFRDVCNHLKDIAAALYKAPLAESEHSLDDKLINHNSLRTAPMVLYRDMSREHWTISNESSNGYGVAFDSELPGTIKLGKLVGLAVGDEPGHLIIGCVKSISKPASRSNQLGIRIIGRRANWIQLRHVSLNNSSGTGEIHAKFPAIHLQEEHGLSDRPSLLLPRIEYLESGIYQLDLQNRPSIVQLIAPVEIKDDWVQVYFTPLEAPVRIQPDALNLSSH